MDKLRKRGQKKEKKNESNSSSTYARLKSYKETKTEKLQLYSKPCLMVEGCYGKRMKLERKRELRKISIFVFFSSQV